MKFRSLLYCILAWTMAVGLYLLIRFWGTQDRIDWAERMDTLVVFWILCGVVLGLVYWSTNLLTDRPSIRHRSYGILIGIRVAVLFLSLLLLGFLSLVLVMVRGDLAAEQLLPTFVERMGSPRLIAGTIYFLSVAAVMSFVRQMSIMVGPRTLRNLMLGRYHHPKAEERIFMFLDLKSSTTHAERLGHTRFCELIQDCFRDLTDSAVRNEVEIYQYVGDEAIMSWTIEDGIRDFNCLEVHFEFQRELRAKADYYRKTYGLFPEFKAGINSGPVTVAEIGVIKRDIAYLSDVLNTAARIQGKCNEFGRDLLISGNVRDLLPSSDRYRFESIGSVPLKGREESVEIFSVENIAPSAV